MRLYHFVGSALEMAERLGQWMYRQMPWRRLGYCPISPLKRSWKRSVKSVELAETYGLLRIGVRAHHNLGVMISGIQGDQKAARQHYLRAAEIAKKRGVVSEELFSLVNAAEVSLGLGKSYRSRRNASGSGTIVESHRQIQPHSNWQLTASRSRTVVDAW